MINDQPHLVAEATNQRRMLPCVVVYADSEIANENSTGVVLGSVL